MLNVGSLFSFAGQVRALQDALVADARQREEEARIEAERLAKWQAGLAKGRETGRARQLDTQDRILAALKKHGEMRPIEVAKHSGVCLNSTYLNLAALARFGKITNTGTQMRPVWKVAKVKK